VPKHNEESSLEGTTEEHSLDKLAKGLAEDSLTRSRAIKLAGAAVLGEAFSFLALPDEAEAKKKKKKRRRRPPLRAFNFTGSISTTDLIQNGRLVRDGVPSTCASQKAFPGVIDTGARNCDVYRLTQGRAATCITVTLTPACADLQSVAYTFTFNAFNIAQNYVADSGISPASGESVTYSFILGANGTFDVVVNETTPRAGCGSYALRVAGLSPL
jgi:hypothetical protein